MPIEITDLRRRALLCVVGLDGDPEVLRRDLARLGDLPGPARARRQAEIERATSRYRSRLLWRPRAEVEELVGPEAVEELLSGKDPLAEVWEHEDGPQLVPTPLGVESLGIAAAEHSTVEKRHVPPPPRRTLSQLLEAVYYSSAEVDESDLFRIALVRDRKGEVKARKRRAPRPLPDEVIVEEDYWDFTGPASEATPRIPTRRGVYQLEDDWASRLVAKDRPPGEEDDPVEYVQVRWMGREFSVQKGSEIDLLIGPSSPGYVGPEAAELRGGLGRATGRAG